MGFGLIKKITAYFNIAMNDGVYLRLMSGDELCSVTWEICRSRRGVLGMSLKFLTTLEMMLELNKNPTKGLQHQ